VSRAPELVFDAAAALVLLATVWASVRAGRRAEGDELAMAVLVPAGLLLYPGALAHYTVVLLAPLIWLWSRYATTAGRGICIALVIALVYGVTHHDAGHDAIAGTAALWITRAQPGRARRSRSPVDHTVEFARRTTATAGSGWGGSSSPHSAAVCGVTAQIARLYALIVGVDPRQMSFEFALWTREMVRPLIRREFGVALSVVSVGRLLRAMGLSPQRPLHRAYQLNPEAVARWKKEEFAAIRAGEIDDLPRDGVRGQGSNRRAHRGPRACEAEGQEDCGRGRPGDQPPHPAPRRGRPSSPGRCSTGGGPPARRSGRPASSEPGPPSWSAGQEPADPAVPARPDTDAKWGVQVPVGGYLDSGARRPHSGHD